MININTFGRVEELNQVLKRNDRLNLKNIETIFWHFSEHSEQHCSQVSFYGDYQNTSTVHSENDLFFLNLHNISKNVFENNSITLEMVFKEFQKSRENEEQEAYLDFDSTDE